MYSIILASTSPRRRALLRQAGIRFRVVRNRVNENDAVFASVNAECLAVRLAKEKASDVARRIRRATVLGADTVVIANGRILGKPSNKIDAARMLRILSGHWHDVITGIAIIKDGEMVAGMERTRIKFRRLCSKEIEDYIASGEPMGKAGAYAIQGGARSFVECIQGDYTNVVGLPLNLTVTLLSELKRRA